MKKIIMFVLVAVTIIAWSAPAYAATIDYPIENVRIVANSDGIKKINVIGSKNTYFLDGNELFAIEASPVNANMQPLSETDSESLNTIVTDIKVYKTKLTKDERDALRDAAIVTPMSGPLTNTMQAQNLMGHIRATLSVSYGRPIYGGVQTLHLCKATGTFVYLIPPSSEGVAARTSQLFYSAIGRRYINGVEENVVQIGLTENYSTPTFSNVQLMPENTSMDLEYGLTGVIYTLYATRGVTIEVNMPFN